MARLEQLSRQKYAMETSPLFGIRSRKRLVEVLGWQGGDKTLDVFAGRPDNHNCFLHEEDGKKPRPVQQPKPKLEALHRRIARLLLRITSPGYLHSGLRGRSFVTNAAQHVSRNPAVKIDVQKFYPSTLHSHVCGFFKNQMACAPDVAGLLASLCCVTVDGVRHLPTGSPLSQILAFYAHKQMFDELNAYVSARGGVITVYVDDITATMEFASMGDIRAMGRIVNKHGLEWHKEHFFRRGRSKAITGAIAKADHLEAPKKQHLKYARARDLVDSPSVLTADRKLAARSAIGLLQCIAQIDDRQVSTAKGMAQKLSAVAGL